MGARSEGLRGTLANGTEEEQLMAVLGVEEDADGLVQVLEGALDGAKPRVRVAILDALYRLKQDPQVKNELEKVMVAAPAGDDGEELYMMARVALNRVENDDDDAISADGQVVAVLGVPATDAVDKMAVIVHGTWASDGSWWRSGGDFHTYLKDDKGLDYVYDAEEPFIWSGRNTESDRQGAAKAFGKWVTRHKPKHLEVFAHSHGANVAMLSTKQGLRIQKLVMMSPPVRADYYADWDKITKGQAYNIQASFDPVVAIARGGQWFKIPQVKELELDKWGHSRSHEPAMWEKFDVPNFVGL